MQSKSCSGTGLPNRLRHIVNKPKKYMCSKGENLIQWIQLLQLVILTNAIIRIAKKYASKIRGPLQGQKRKSKQTVQLLTNTRLMFDSQQIKTIYFEILQILYKSIVMGKNQEGQPHQSQNTESANGIHLKVDLNTFKVEQCKEHHHLIYAPYYFNCSYYHSIVDYRRCPYLDIKQQTLVYNQIYISDGFDSHSCLNFIEYLYHPKNYKTQQCENQHCHRQYCPKIHKIQPLYEKQSKVQKNDPVPSPSPSSPYIQQLQKRIQEMRAIRELNTEKLTNIQNEEIKSLLLKQSDNINRLTVKMHELNQQQQKHQQNVKVHIKKLANISDQTPPQNQVENFTEFNRNQRLNIIEDRYHQFKMFKQKQPRQIAQMVLEYISAFLNSEGGSIYLGVDDDSFVRGLDVSQKWIDQLLLAIDNDGKTQLSPPLIPQKYQIKIIPVRNNKLWLNVIEIKVFPQNTSQNKILTLFNRQCYLRMNASNHRLSASDIMQYMRLNKNIKITESLQGYNDQIESMSLQQAKQLQQKLLKLNSKLSQVIRKNQKKIAEQQTQQN